MAVSTRAGKARPAEKTLISLPPSLSSRGCEPPPSILGVGSVSRSAWAGGEDESEVACSTETISWRRGQGRRWGHSLLPLPPALSSRGCEPPPEISWRSWLRLLFGLGGRGRRLLRLQEVLEFIFPEDIALSSVETSWVAESLFSALWAGGGGGGPQGRVTRVPLGLQRLSSPVCAAAAAAAAPEVPAPAVISLLEGGTSSAAPPHRLLQKRAAGEGGRRGRRRG
jgi:hypothetical protein